MMHKCNCANIYCLTIIIFFLCFPPWDAIISATIISTSSGRVTGYHFNLPTHVSDEDVIHFYGIPYAEPPVGSLRFRPTKALLESDSNYANIDVKNEVPPFPCPQTQHLPEFSHQSLPTGGQNATEDCLKLNVYLPGDYDRHKPLPILIWIPGEGFNYADIVQYDGSALAAKGKIIVITVNYRVGVFGFMSSGNGTLSGNAALHDILNAINWTKVNARVFNGNPDNITLAGRFSGSMAISTLVVSPVFMYEKNENGLKSNVPLAKRVILHGGIATGRYVMDLEPLETLNILAQLTHCTRSTLVDTIECLQYLPAEELLKESLKVPQLWKPVIDGYLVEDDPLELMIHQKFPADVDILIGDNNGAGSLCFLTHSYRKTDLLGKIVEDRLKEKDLNELIMNSLQEFYDFKEGSDGLESVVSHEYMYESDETSYRSAWLRFCGIMYIRYPVEVAARSIARSNKSRVFRYEWGYKPLTSPWVQHKWLTAPLGDEIIFVFPNNDTKFSETDLAVRDDFMISWINFVKFGNVCEAESCRLDWPQFDNEMKHMMSFTDSGMKSGSTSFLDRDVHFWREAIDPLVKTLRQFDKLAQNYRSCSKPTPLEIAQPTALSQALLAIVILLGLIVAAFCIYFFVKNWGKPRAMWSF